MLLACEMFEFGDSSVIVVIRKIDRANRLIVLRVRPMLVLEANRAVGQFTVTVVKICVERTGKHNMSSADLMSNLEEIDADLDMDVRMVEHLFEHSRIAVQGHLLKCIGSVTVIMIFVRVGIRAATKAASCGWIKAPLFARIAPEEFFVRGRARQR